MFFSFSVCKDPPYKVEESGYAGFILPIEVYFKNKVRNHFSFKREKTNKQNKIKTIWKSFKMCVSIHKHSYN